MLEKVLKEKEIFWEKMKRKINIGALEYFK